MAVSTRGDFCAYQIRKERRTSIDEALPKSDPETGACCSRKSIIRIIYSKRRCSHGEGEIHITVFSYGTTFEFFHPVERAIFAPNRCELPSSDSPFSFSYSWPEFSPRFPSGFTTSRRRFAVLFPASRAAAAARPGRDVRLGKLGSYAPAKAVESLARWYRMKKNHPSTFPAAHPSSQHSTKTLIQ